MAVDFEIFDWEFSPEARLAFLLKQKDLYPDDGDIDTLLKIHEVRFAKVKGVEADLFMRLWVTMSSAAAGGSGAYKNKSFKKELLDAIDEPALKEIRENSTNGMHLLKHEYANSLYRYYAVCMTDRSFTSGTFGLMKLSKEKVLQKLHDIVHAMSDILPSQMGLEKELSFYSILINETFEIFEKKSQSAFLFMN